MKRNLLYISFFLIIAALSTFFPAESASHWKKVKNITSGYEDAYWLDVIFLDSDKRYGWVCGRDGRVAFTIDSGKTWQGRTIPDGGQLESIDFVDPLNGYTSGNGYIFKSTDGGRTWRNVSPTSVPNFLWGNFFLDANTGLTIGGGCGDEQFFFRTTNGGTSWTLFMDNVPNTGLSDLILYDRDGLGYASSSGRIWRTMDGGRTWSIFAVSGDEDWQEELTHIGNSFLVPFSKPCTGGEFGVGGMRFSTNLGSSWREYDSRQPMFGAFLLDSLRGWACGWNESVYYTSDGGRTWELKNCGIEAGDWLDDLWFVNDSLGWLVGDGIYRTFIYDSLHPLIEALGNTEFCEGDSVILSPTESYEHYNWSNGDTTKTTVITEAGVYQLVVSNSRCDSAKSNSYKITILPNPNPQILADDYEICEGDSTVLSLSPGYVEYLWSNGATTSSILVKQEGLYSVTVTDTNGCKGKDSVYINVLPNPVPKITQSRMGHICVGDTITLETADGYVLYQWYDEEKSELIEEGSRSIKVYQSGKYYVKVRNANGCEGISDTVEITVLLDSNRIELLSMNPLKREYEIDSTMFLEVNCSVIRLTNRGVEPETIDDIKIFRNIEFSIPQTQLPLTILPGDTVDLVVCYSPTALGRQSDTLEFDDHCQPHSFILVSWGKPDSYNAGSRCELKLYIKSSGIKHYLFRISAPYPNPPSEILYIPYSKFVPDGSECKESYTLYNVLGIPAASGFSSIDLKQVINSGVYEEGKIRISTKHLEAGIYIFTFEACGERLSYPIVIMK